MNQEIVGMVASAGLALVMLGIGLSLSVRDFAEVFMRPKALVAALTSQMLALPLIALCIALVLPLSPELKVGLVVLAASPGGSTSGFLTYLFQGNVALSVSLTTLNSFLTLFSIPVIVNIALNWFMQAETDISLSVKDMLTHVLGLTLVPVGVGLGISHWAPGVGRRAERYLRYVISGILVVVFGLQLLERPEANGTPLSLPDVLHILPPALLLNVACFFFGFYLLRRLGLGHADQITAAIESGVHNTLLALTIAFTLLHNTEIAKVALVYALFSFWTAMLFAWWMNRRAARRSPSPSASPPAP